MQTIFPKKLKKGSHIRVIAPARTFQIISQECREIALKRFEEMGIRVTYSKHAEEKDEALSSSIESRVSDIMEAFKDPSVDAIFTAIGGFNSNQLLPYLDYETIKNNPKIFCGFSDITSLLNGIYAKTGLVTYAGPHFSSFGMKHGFEYTLEYFKKILMNEGETVVLPSKKWSDDLWFIDQEKRDFVFNDGHWIINKGSAEGVALGENIDTFLLLNGTPFMPDLTNSILFLEATADIKDAHFDRMLQSLVMQKDFDKKVKGIIIGRFQKGSEITREKLVRIIKNKVELNHIPVIVNVDFGHASPIITFPIGGSVKIENDRIIIGK